MTGGAIALWKSDSVESHPALSWCLSGKLIAKGAQASKLWPPYPRTYPPPPVPCQHLPQFLPSSALSTTACGAPRALGRRSLLVQTPPKHPGVQLLAAMCSSPKDLTQNCARAACPANSLLSFPVLLNKTVLPTNKVHDSLAPVPAPLSRTQSKSLAFH